MTFSRDARIDFFRGLALIFIFWDHIPNNILANFTIRNIGFSDAAEIFVFLAGYASMMVYGGLMVRKGYAVALLHIIRRTWHLYITHVFVMAMLMAIVFVTNEQIATRDVIEEMGLSYFVAHPQQAVIDEMLLRFKPNLTDPLPLYIAFSLILPLLLPLLRKWPLLVLASSALLYGFVQAFGWNVPAQPDGYWFFNPLAWQFLFVIGAVCFTAARAGVWQRRVEQPADRLLWLAMVYLVCCAPLTLLWRWPALHDIVVSPAVADWLYPISKTDLAPLRLLHFLALAYVAVHFVRRGEWLARWLPAQVCVLGRHSLAVFCFGVVLIPVVDMLNWQAGDDWRVRLLTPLLGLVLMILLAKLEDVHRNGD